MANDHPIFTRDNLPADIAFGTFRKRTLTRAARIPGAFEVETREGTLYIPEGGWLAIDAHGYPYPIACEEFDAIYEDAQHG